MHVTARLLTLATLTVLAGLVVACGSSPAGHPSASSSGPAGSSSSASPSSSATTSPATSVTAGMVRAGPASPVSRPGQQDSRPVLGQRVEALRGGKVAYISYTDHDGRFRFTVPPGTYVIAPILTGLHFDRPQSKTVTAAAGHKQFVDFLLDTGIR